MNLKPEELVSSLRCCAEGDCWCCRLHNDAHRCQETLLGSAAELIERLEKEKAALINTIRGFCRAIRSGCLRCFTRAPKSRSRSRWTPYGLTGRA